MNFGLNTTDTRQAALYFRQAQATFECIASEFSGSALGFYVPQLFASPFSETIDDFPRNRPSLYTSYIHHIYIYMYIRECKFCMILHVQCEGFLVSLHAEDLPLVDRALCNALVEGPTRELAVARCQIFHQIPENLGQIELLRQSFVLFLVFVALYTVGFITSRFAAWHSVGYT